MIDEADELVYGDGGGGEPRSGRRLDEGHEPRSSAVCGVASDVAVRFSRRVRRYDLYPVFPEGGIRFAMKGTHLTLVTLTEHHDEPPGYEIHNLNANEHRVANHRRMNQEEQ